MNAQNRQDKNQRLGTLRRQLSAVGKVAVAGLEGVLSSNQMTRTPKIKEAK